MADTDTLDDMWSQWKTTNNPDHFDKMIQASKPVIDSALTSYAGGNKALTGKAKVLAANAIKTYDPSHGTKLRTHIMTQLQPLIRMHRETNAVIKMPERVYIDLYKSNNEYQKFSDEHGREPSDLELADRTGLSAKRLNYIRRFSKGEMYEGGMKTPSEEGEEVYYPGVQQVSPKTVWTEYLHHDLPPVDQKILEWKTGFGGHEILSTNDIAKRLSITPSAVSQRSAKIAKLLAEGQGMDIT